MPPIVSESTPCPEKRFKMDHNKRGYLVVVDNHTFNNPGCSDLTGSEHDVKNLIETFVYNFDFELVLKQNQTKAQMIDLMKRFAQEVDHSNRDCFMAVFLSHGFTNAKNEQLICAFDKDFLLADLTDPFITCSTLDGKPKIFFCDLCRGSKSGTPSMPKRCRRCHLKIKQLQWQEMHLNEQTKREKSSLARKSFYLALALVMDTSVVSCFCK